MDRVDNIQLVSGRLRDVFECQQRTYRAHPNPGKHERIINLELLEEIILRNESELIDAMSEDFGHRSRHESTMLDIVSSLAAVRHSRKHVGGWMSARKVPTPLQLRPSRSFILPQPLGVIGIITPWNFPAVLVARKVGAALAAGCTVVLKASEFTPYSATVIIKALVEAGLPDGAVNLVFGDPAAVSEQLLSAPAVKIVSFTGSTHVGKLLAGQAAKNLTRCVFELGGHAPVIVWKDADPERVIQITAPAKFGTAGQSCVAPTRYLVHENLHDQIVKGLVAKAESLQIGHGLEEGTTLGPVAHAGRIKEFNDLIEDAVSKGAVIETGGQQVDRPGFFFKPTVLSNVPEDAKILFEEPFGPIATVQKITSVEQALKHANAAPYAFAAYLFTDSMRVRSQVVAELNASNLGINQTAPSLPDVALGGLGNSGYGYEGGSEGVLAYTQLKLINQSAI